MLALLALVSTASATMCRAIQLPDNTWECVTWDFYTGERKVLSTHDYIPHGYEDRRYFTPGPVVRTDKVWADRRR